LGLIAISLVLGEKMNQNQLLGCLLVWGFLVSWAVALFWSASRPFFALRHQFSVLRIPCFVSVIALIFAVIQIPIWSAMTNEFPPYHFSAAQATVTTLGVLFSLLGPGAPGIVVFAQRIWEINKEKRRSIKEKKLSQQGGPPDRQ
jgi:hypothetical protein